MFQVFTGNHRSRGKACLNPWLHLKIKRWSTVRKKNRAGENNQQNNILYMSTQTIRNQPQGPIHRLSLPQGQHRSWRWGSMCSWNYILLQEQHCHASSQRVVHGSRISQLYPAVPLALHNPGSSIWWAIYDTICFLNVTQRSYICYRTESLSNYYLETNFVVQARMPIWFHFLQRDTVMRPTGWQIKCYSTTQLSTSIGVRK